MKHLAFIPHLTIRLLRFSKYINYPVGLLALLMLSVILLCQSCGGKEPYVPPIEAYEAFCIDMTEKMNNGERRFGTEFFNEKELVGRIISFLPNNPRINASLRKNSRDIMVMLNKETRELEYIEFNKLQNKNGRQVATFLLSYPNRVNYIDLELGVVDSTIKAVDYYNYASGMYISQFLGESFKLSLEASESHYAANGSGRPFKVVTDIQKYIALNDLHGAWNAFNSLGQQWKDNKAMFGWRIMLATLSDVEIYCQKIEEILKEEKRDPRFFYFHRSNCFFNSGQYEEAIEMFNKLFEYTGKGTYDYQTLAIAYALAGKYDQALKEADTLTDFYPADDGTPLAYEGLIYFLANDTSNFNASFITLLTQMNWTTPKLIDEMKFMFPVLNDSSHQNFRIWAENASQTPISAPAL